MPQSLKNGLGIRAQLEHPIEAQSVSIIIPTFNGARRIGNCLDALQDQAAARNAEILVVDDGSTDSIAEVIRRYSQVRLITQTNAGPAAARNRGAAEARGSIILFTDDDCVPTADWLDEMLEPFSDPEIVGAKGVYRTRQKSVAARFVQIEYEDRYNRMADSVERVTGRPAMSVREFVSLHADEFGGRRS